MSLESCTTVWIVAEGNTGSYPFQVRLRQFSMELSKHAFPLRLNVFWSILKSDDKAYPTKSELERLHSFENRLVKAMETDDFAVLTMVLTGRNEREFVLYTSDRQEFLRRLSQMPSEADPYPIKIYCHEDPRWEYYEKQVAETGKGLAPSSPFN